MGPGGPGGSTAVVGLPMFAQSTPASPPALTSSVRPATGLTVTVARAIDGGAFAAGALSAVTEVAFGIYRVDFAASDLNGDNITFRATAAASDDLLVTIETDP